MAAKGDKPPKTPDSATRMFRLDTLGQRRGVDDVIDRLRQPDGWAWWEGMMRDFPPASGEDRTRAELEHLKRAKDSHKAALVSLSPGPERTNATALYYACIAAALAHHGKRITGQKDETLREALLDLAASTPEPWSAMIKKASATA
jgi:hypothetical protein